MICSSSIISTSSPSLDLLRKSTTSPPLSLPFTSHFAGVKSSAAHPGLKKSVIIAGGCGLFSASAIAAPNSSALSEEALRGQNGVGRDSLDASESEYESVDHNGDVLADGGGDDNDLALSVLELLSKEVGDQDEELAEGIKLYAIPTIRRSKPTILIDLMTVYARGGKTIVFTQTTRDAVEVLKALPKNMVCGALHDEISQHQREITLDRFREGKFPVLVATDFASRVLDIPNVDLVIYYELPDDRETFAHSWGRTGRAGKEGTVILMFSNDQRRTLRSLEHDVRSKIEFISAPTVVDVFRASADQVVATLAGVHPEYVEFFTPMAQKLIDEQGTSALAAAIARLTGFSRPPSSRSLISQEQGWVTLQLTRDSDIVRGFLSVRSVSQFLSDVYSKAAERVGNIQIILDERIQGAVFELPEETANELLTKQITPGHTITKITELPPLQDEARMKVRSSRGGRGGSSGSSYRGRFSDGDDSRDSFRRSGGRGRSGNSWSQNSRSSGSDWRTSRSPSYGNRDSNRSFEGACFNCGQSGHRSADCPSKRGY